MLKNLTSGISAGILISIGGAVFLSCGDSRYIGALLFTVALLCICYRGYALYTGRVGYMVESHKKEDVSSLFIALFGNTVGTVVCGYGIRYAIPATGEAAQVICDAKLLQAAPSTLIRAIFCGVLMYLAVSIFRDKGTPLGILFCVPVFIIAGFEHSIADIFYFAASGIVSARACGFIWIVILGNSIGAVILPLLNYKKVDSNGK